MPKNPGRWPWSRRRDQGPRPWSLSAPLLRWNRQEVWTVGQSFENLLVTGGTGSGKTSATGRSVALAMLKAGYSGLVTTVKPDEASMWREYCRLAGREDDLVVIGADCAHGFNALDYEARLASGSGLTENIVSLFTTLAEVGERHKGASSGGGRGEDPFWALSGKQLTRNLVDLSLLATGHVSVPELHRLLLSAPSSVQEADSVEWRERSLCFRLLQQADRVVPAPSRRQDLECVAGYFLREFPGLAPRTRSVIVATFTSLADILNRGLLRRLVCDQTTITPDAILDEGKIIVLDLPLLVYREVGLYAQTIWKLLTQRAIQRRDVRTSSRPVFLCMDECQYFITSGDMLYLSTCRASRAATVLLTQNLPNLVAALGGGDKGRAECDSIAGNCVTKVFHANGDSTTCEWASTLIGKTRQFFASGSCSHGPVDWLGSLTGLSSPSGSTGGFSEQLDFEVPPHTFTRLRTGGPSNGYQADAIVFRSGSVFASTGTTWLPVTFDQRTV